MKSTVDKINYTQATTLSSIFKERATLSPDKVAYTQYHKASKSWHDFTWKTMAEDVSRWQQSFIHEGFVEGDKIALMVSNSREWILVDQAALGLGLIVVPLYVNDRPDNIGYILDDAQIKCLVIENKTQLNALLPIQDKLEKLQRIIHVHAIEKMAVELSNTRSMNEWIATDPSELISKAINPEHLATIVYTSGTTGNPKGVMLSHKNILSNLYSGLTLIDVFSHDVFLSFLPLSHMLERTAGYYLPIVCGSSVAFSRSIPQLGEDLVTIKPTIMISVPRIFERVYTKIMGTLANESTLKNKLFANTIKLGWKKFNVQQHRAPWSLSLLFQPILDHLVASKVREKLGGNLRFTICGGAALSEDIAQFFIGLGIPILQGYGLTETSPVIAVNTLENNIPKSVGLTPDSIEVKIGDNDELLTRSDSVMLGYWKNDQATQEMIDQDHWLHTGDKAKIENGHIYITGRIKDIIVLSNGEKVPPADMELAISLQSLIEQVIIVGEAKPFLSALVVVSEEAPALKTKDLVNEVKQCIKSALKEFPGYAKVRQVRLCTSPWSIENGLMTPTLKLKRAKIEKIHAADIEDMYQGHL